MTQGERYFADGLRELLDNRRLAILAVCAGEWEMFLVDVPQSIPACILLRNHAS